MKRFSILLSTVILIALMFNRAPAQSSFAVVKANGTTVITGTFKTALDNAVNGDIIYLPMGTVDVAGVLVNKGVHIIGAGYNPDSTGSTGQSMISGNLFFVSGSDNGSVQGVYVNGSISFGNSLANSEVHNFVITRCYIEAGLYLGFAWDAITAGSNFTITENIINYGICGARANNVLLSNNIIVQITPQFRPITLMRNAIITNNILIPVDNNVSNMVTNTTFKNNIIVIGSLAYVNEYSGNAMLNNLHCSIPGLNTNGVTQTSGNVYIDRDKIFIKQSGGTYNYRDNYHLTPAAISAITGTDGTQVGIYGTTNAFKDGGLPPIPAIVRAKVSTKTNAKGKLEVEFNVQAQSK